jgi:hypothetical protein
MPMISASIFYEKKPLGILRHPFGSPSDDFHATSRYLGKSGKLNRLITFSV